MQRLFRLILLLLAPSAVWAQGVPAGAPPGAAVPSTNPAPSAKASATGAPVIENPQPGPPQPIPFNHTQHGASAKLTCNDCHAPSKNGNTVAMPQAKQCMTCHATVDAEKPDIAQLAAAAKSGDPIVWNRVYSVPSFVQFSHTVHNGSSCEACHGQVEQQAVVAKVRDSSMGGCISCHAAQGAPVGCGTCHELQSRNGGRQYWDADRKTLARLGLAFSTRPLAQSAIPPRNTAASMALYLSSPPL